jgi:hypothetical protein
MIRHQFVTFSLVLCVIVSESGGWCVGSVWVFALGVGGPNLFFIFVFQDARALGRQPLLHFAALETALVPEHLVIDHSQQVTLNAHNNF